MLLYEQGVFHVRLSEWERNRRYPPVIFKSLRG